MSSQYLALLIQPTRMASPATGFFQGRFRLMILLLLTSQYCLSSQVPSTQMKGATSSITGLPGLFFRLLTPTLGVGVDSGWVHREWGSSRSSGFDTTNLTIKGEIYRNDLHETLVSTGLAWGIGHSGAQGAGANAPDLIAPGIFFGKGFGDLPANLAWLRPFGITSALTLEHPMTGTSTNSGVDPVTGQRGPLLTHNVDTLHWGFAIEFSTLYLTNRFTPGKLPREEPLNQLVPLVEFSFVSPRGQKTVATMNPGLSYVAVSWQVAAEAIVPLNGEAGRSIGVRAQLLLFLDELIPSLFGKPLLSP